MALCLTESWAQKFHRVLRGLDAHKWRFFFIIIVPKISFFWYLSSTYCSVQVVRYQSVVYKPLMGEQEHPIVLCAGKNTYAYPKPDVYLASIFFSKRGLW